MNDVTGWIQSFEGLRFKLYRDTSGHISIGYGRNLEAVGISKPEADTLFANDLQAAKLAATIALGFDAWNNLDPVRQAALTDMAFNLGSAGLEGFKNMLAFVRSGDFDHAADELMNSRYATELPKRAEANATLIRTGIWPGDDPTVSENAGAADIG